MNKFKKIVKYTLNGINMINALLLALAPIWGFNVDKISDTIVAVAGIVSLYLLGGKLFQDPELETQTEPMPEHENDEVNLED